MKKYKWLYGLFYHTCMWLTQKSLYNNTSLANDYCYNEQLVGGEDLHPLVAIVSNIYVTIRAEGYSIWTNKFTIIGSFGPKAM